LLPCKENEKWGVYNTHLKKWILPLQFNDISISDEEFPLIKAKRNLDKNYFYYDFNGNLILSEKLEIEYEGREYLIFNKNGTQYQMKYNKEKQKFIWHKQ